MNIYQEARLKYKPRTIKFLFVAEAPPENIKRFFYFEDVKTHDYLFINLIRLLYPEHQARNGGSVVKIRQHKEMLLKRFKNDGYYLIDALSEPISLKLSSSERRKLIKSRKEEIAKEIRAIIQKETKIILLKATVYEVLCKYFVEQENLPVVNNDIKVPFPVRNHKPRFADHLHKILSINDTGYRGRTKFVSYSGDVVITA